MIETKFKAWDSIYNKMLYNIWPIGNEKYVTWEEDLFNMFIERPTIKNGNDLVWLQFIGFKDNKDKDGKRRDSYHKDLVLFNLDSAVNYGDIIYSSNKGNVVGMIEWMDDGWVIVDKDGKHICGLWYCFVNCNGIVIGNKYETPDLLENN